MWQPSGQGGLNRTAAPSPWELAQTDSRQIPRSAEKLITEEGALCPKRHNPPTWFNNTFLGTPGRISDFRRWRGESISCKVTGNGNPWQELVDEQCCMFDAVCKPHELDSTDTGLA